MIYISHRGNIIGSDSGKDNNPDYVEKALRSGYDVEVDVWGISDRFLLGHDYPTYRIEPGFLTREKIWCHAKNPRAIVELKKLGAHFFWHGNDDYTLTSRGFVWTYPGKALTTESIAVLPETTSEYTLQDFKNIKGICSDRIGFYKNCVV